MKTIRIAVAGMVLLVGSFALSAKNESDSVKFVGGDPVPICSPGHSCPGWPGSTKDKASANGELKDGDPRPTCPPDGCPTRLSATYEGLVDGNPRPLCPPEGCPTQPSTNQ